MLVFSVMPDNVISWNSLPQWFSTNYLETADTNTQQFFPANLMEKKKIQKEHFELPLGMYKWGVEEIQMEFKCLERAIWGSPQLQTPSIKTGAWSHCEGLPAQMNHLLQVPRFKLILIHIFQLVILSPKKKKCNNCISTKLWLHWWSIEQRESVWKLRSLCRMRQGWKDLVESQCAWIVLWQLLEFLLLLIRFLTGNNQRVRVAHCHLERPKHLKLLLQSANQRYSH